MRSLVLSLSVAPTPVIEDRAAWQALWNLVCAGMSDEYLLQVLDAIWLKAAGRDQGQQAKNWALPSGLSRRELNNLPKRIEDLAKCIEQVNSHELFASSSSLGMVYFTKGLRRAAQMAVRSPRIRSPAESLISLDSLPYAMRAYAAHLRSRIEQVGNLRKGPAKGGRSEFEMKQEILKLIVAVKDVTGKSRWTDLVNVLNPILPTQVKWVADGDALRSFYNQNKKLLFP